MNTRCAAASDVGRKRSANEDSYLVDKKLGLFIVCDGMGGHKAGEVASSLAVQMVRKEVLDSKDELETLAESTSPSRVRVHELLRNAVRKASLSIYEKSKKSSELRGMGTTLTSMLLVGQRAFIAHVGDSRLYLHRGGEVHQITTDHSLVNEMIRAGKLSPSQAKNVPFTNALTRAVGVYPNVAVDILEVDLLPGDQFLLCSDGLHGYLEEPDLLTGLEQTFEQRVNWFIDFANGAGGKDNITALIVEIREVGDAEKSARLRLTFDTLHTIPLFRHLTYAEMVRVINVCRAREVNEGDIIIRQGEEGDALYVILEGQVSVWQSGMQVNTLGPGRHFGEMALLDNQPRSATIKADEKSVLIRILRQDFYDLLRQDSVTAVKLLWNFLQTLSHRLRLLSSEVTLPEVEPVAIELDPYTEPERFFNSDAFAKTDPEVDISMSMKKG